MELPLVANYDDLRRCQDALTDGTAEIGMGPTLFTKAHIFIHSSKQLNEIH